MADQRGEVADGDEPDLVDLLAPPERGPREALRSLALDLGLTPRAALISLVVGAALLVGAWWWWHDPPPSGAEASIPLASPVTAAGPPTSVVPSDVVAHAAGAVAAPGVYTLPPGSRVADLLEAAGGAQPDADLDRVNLAAPLLDGAQVHLPRIGEPAPPAPSGGAGTPVDGAVAVDLNTAGAEELEQLPGVGPATAAAIIAHREEQGPFATVDDLIAVRGIGEAKLEALREQATV